MQVTLGQLVKYVLENRTGNAFRAYSEEAIASGIKRASEDGTLFYSTRDDNSVCGIVVAFYDKAKDTMHVHDILCTERWVLPEFIRAFRDRWPTATLTACRRALFVRYNTESLVRKLSVMKGTI